MKRFIGLLAIFSFGACSSPASVGSTGEAIINGTDDTADPGVVMVISQKMGSMEASLCTGEVISPHVVLTAAHCVDPAVIGTGATTYVFIGNVLPTMSAPPAGTIFAAETVQFDSMFDMNNPQNGFDVGLAILPAAQPLTITPVPYNQVALPSTMVNAPVRIIGYGITDGSDSMGTTAGTKRVAPTVIANITNLLVGLQDGMHGICEGDSGGPALAMFGSTEKIVGVTSFGPMGCPLTVPAGTGFYAGNDTNIGTYASFINMYVNMYDPPAVGQGGACTSDTDCTPLSCVQSGNSKVCEPQCDPTVTPSTCPAGTTCTDVDGSTVCVAPGGGGGSGGSGGGSGHGGKSSGCALGGDAPMGGAGLLLAMVALMALRRRARARA